MSRQREGKAGNTRRGHHQNACLIASIPVTRVVWRGEHGIRPLAMAKSVFPKCKEKSPLSKRESARQKFENYYNAHQAAEAKYWPAAHKLSTPRAYRGIINNHVACVPADPNARHGLAMRLTTPVSARQSSQAEINDA